MTASTLSSLFSQVKLPVQVFYSNNILFKFASKDQKRSSQDGEWQLLNYTCGGGTYIVFSDTLYMVTIYMVSEKTIYVTPSQV